MSFNINSNIKTRSGLSASDLQNAEKALSAGNGYHPDVWQAIVDAEKQYGLNALFILAHADIESAHGNSYYARTRNNLFGFNAVDSDPNQASTYPSQAAAINFYANFLNKYYLTKGAVYYNGTTPHGVFVRYSSSHDSEAQSVVGLMNQLQAHVGQSGGQSPAPSKPSPKPTGALYAVKRGDTLWAIANAHGLSVARLLQLNPQIKNPDKIYPGQVVRVSGAPVAASTYTVQRGDYLIKIANKFRTTLSRLLRLNPSIKDPNKIYPGEKIKTK